MSWTCVQCGWLVEFDDAIAPTLTGRCFCVFCERHMNGDDRHVSKRLQREIALEEDALRNQKIGPDPRISQLHGGT
jgi:hypothetical protein